MEKLDRELFESYIERREEGWFYPVDESKVGYVVHLISKCGDKEKDVECWSICLNETNMLESIYRAWQDSSLDDLSEYDVYVEKVKVI